MFFRRKTQNINQKTEAGFSIVELLVVMAIFLVITSISVFNYGKFSSNLIVTNLAYEAALAVRQAQVYGISVKKGASGTNFNSAYGVWFAKPSGADLNQSFYLFSDQDGDNKYTIDGGVSEIEETFTMNGSNIVDDFCVTGIESGIPVTKCSKTGGINSMAIIFKRPEPNAKIYAFNGDTSVSGSFTEAQIIFTSGRGDKRARMTVTSTGQISIDSCNNPLNTPACPE